MDAPNMAFGREPHLDVSLSAALEQVADELMNHPGADPQGIIAKFPQHASQLGSLLPALALLANPSPSDDLGGALLPADGDPAGPLPRTLGDFRIEREIGRGGMGVVYEAQQISLGRKVALKVLPLAGMLDHRRLIRFQNEARAAATLHHPHIVPVYFVGDERGVHFYAMQLIRGRSLADAIAAQRLHDPVVAPAAHSDASNATPPTPNTSIDTAHGPQARVSTLPEKQQNEYFREIARIGAQVARALDHAHSQGVLHRDIKPANILLDEQGNAWVTDFGLARLEGDLNVTLTGDLLGTLRYMSPEQASGKRATVDHRADVYSLGATLYELLTLRPMVNGSSREEILRQVVTLEPIRLHTRHPHLPLDLETIVLRAVAKYPEDRYPDATALADDLDRFLCNAPIEAKPATLIDRLRRWSRSHRQVVAMGTGLLLFTTALLAATSAVVTLSWRAEQRSREQAEQNLQVAQRAIDKWYLEFADDWLDDRAGLVERQREVLRNAADFYQELQTDKTDAPSRQHGVAAAKRRLSRIYRDLGQSAEADREASLAATILERLVHAPDAKPEYRQELANLWMQQYNAIPADRRDELRRAAERAVQLLTRARQDRPQDASIMMDLALAEAAYGTWFHEEHQYDASDRHFVIAVGLAEQAVATSPDNLRYLRQLAKILHFASCSHLTRFTVHVTGAPRLGRRDEAARLYLRSLEIARELVKRDPESIRNRRTLMNCLGDSLQVLSSEKAVPFLQEAVREGETLLQRDSTRSDLRHSALILYGQLRQTYENLNRYQDAYDTLKTYKPLGPWTPDDDRLEASILKKLGRLAEAQEILERLVAKQLTTIAEQNDLAQFALPLAYDFEELITVLDQQGKRAEAQEARQRCTEFYHQQLARPIPSAPDLAASAHFARGRMFKFLHQDEESLAENAQVLECGTGAENTSLAAALLNRLATFNERKAYEQSLAEATRLTELRPEISHAWAFRAFALDQLGRPKDALEHVDRAIELSHGAGWRDTRALVLWHLGRFTEAVTECNQVLEQEKPSDTQDLPRYLLVQIFCDGPTELRDFDRAYHLAHEIRNVHDRAEAVSLVHMARGEWPQARDQLHTSLAEGNLDAGVLVSLARTYCELNDLEKTKRLYEQAIEAAKLEPPVWHKEHARMLNIVSQRLATGG